MKWWYWHRFGAEALVRQGAWDAAIAYADGCRTAQGYDDRQIDRYCEDVLIKCVRADDAYRRYGLKTATGRTYLAIFRDMVKRYPDRDRRQVLLDLIEARGETGKWFAAAKDAGLLDVALLCARDHATEPATLVRAARDFAAKEHFVAWISSWAKSALRIDIHLRRRYSGRPSFSIRLSDATAIATSVVCRPSVRERSAAPITL